VTVITRAGATYFRRPDHPGGIRLPVNAAGA